MMFAISDTTAEGLGTGIGALLMAVIFVLAFILAIMWLVLPWIIMSKLNRISKQLETAESRGFSTLKQLELAVQNLARIAESTHATAHNSASAAQLLGARSP